MNIETVAVRIIALILFIIPSLALASPSDYGSLPSLQDAEISPDGNSVAILETLDGITVVGIYDLHGGPPALVKVGKLKARDISWAGNDYILILVSSTDRVETTAGIKPFEVWRYVSISRDGENIKYLFSGNGIFRATASSGSLLHTLPSDPEHALFANLDNRQRRAVRMSNITDNDDVYNRGWSVYRVNLKTGKETKVLTGPETANDYIVNALGEPVIRIDYDEDKEQRIVKRRERSNKYKEIASFDEPVESGAIYNFVALSADEKTLYAFGYHGRDTLGVYGLNLENGDIDKTIFHNPEFDTHGLLVDSNTASLIGASYTNHLPETAYFEDEFKNLHDSISSALKGAHVTNISMSLDRDMAVVEVVYPSMPKAFYLFDRKASELSLLGSAYPALASRPKFAREQYNYVSPDSVHIPGYLTYPTDSRSSLPLIVLPHGGPEARDDQSFDWWAAFYASRGYLVYQPNFRGSTGYGISFRSRGYGEWGRLMQDDITNGVKKLINEGVADSERICIVGASYGGYAALAGAALTPNLYACTVSVNGVTDLIAMLGAEAGQSEYNVAYWEKRIGSRFRETSEIEAVSPFHQVHNIKTPVMIIHGTNDTVVPYAQALRMKNALGDANKTYEFVELKDEDHWLSFNDTRIEMLEKSIGFIDAYIGE